jgi:hypothetical protein
MRTKSKGGGRAGRGGRGRNRKMRTRKGRRERKRSKSTGYVFLQDLFPAAHVYPRKLSCEENIYILPVLCTFNCHEPDSLQDIGPQLSS